MSIRLRLGGVISLLDDWIAGVASSADPVFFYFTLMVSPPPRSYLVSNFFFAKSFTFPVTSNLAIYTWSIKYR
jgi:hypothetical protein